MRGYQGSAKFVEVGNRRLYQAYRIIALNPAAYVQCEHCSGIQPADMPVCTVCEGYRLNVDHAAIQAEAERCMKSLAEDIEKENT